MSIAEMSQTLRKEILERLKQQYSTSGGRNAETRLKNFLDYTSTERIRADTDTKTGKHESIMSRGAFQNLANELTSVLNSNSLSTIASKSLSSDITFEAFRQYLVETVKLNTGTGRARVAGGFSYTGASRIGQESGLTIATEITDTPDVPSERDVLILRNIPIGNLVNYYVDFLVDNLELSGSTTKQQAVKELRKQFNAGHLTGAFNARLVRALGLRKNPEGDVVFDNAKTTAVATKAEIELNKIMSLITDADYLSSNIVNDIELFVTTDKRLYKNKVNLQLTTEVQFAKGNQDAGRLLQQAGSAVSALTKAIQEDVSQSGQEAAVEKALIRLYTNLQKLSNEVKAKATAYKNIPTKLTAEANKHLDKILSNTNAIDEIIKSPGSRSIPDHVAYLVECALKGITPQEEKSVAKVKDSALSNKATKSTGDKINLSIAKAKVSSKTTAVKKVPKQFYSLTELQTLVNMHLQSVISANMGDGTAKNVLNYRTGRFAASAKVTQLSESRQGMITAFYEYMKNPYQTFEPGYRQGSPKTRDPKLLIAGSIREIAATKVANRLRAVSV